MLAKRITRHASEAVRSGGERLARAARPSTPAARAAGALAPDRLALRAAAGPRAAGARLDQAALAGLERDLAGMSGLAKADLARLDAFHRPVYGDADLQGRANEVLRDWVFGGEGKDALIAAYRRVAVERRTPTDVAERTVKELLATRRVRWERLAARTGVPVPATFEAYRGVRGDYAVEAVVRAWSDPKATHMIVPSRELASWSLDPAIARSFASDSAASVVYKAEIPLERTLADKWVDGGAFVSLGLEQAEIIVAGAANSLRIPKAQATVTYRGRTYTHRERDALIRAWRADRALPSEPLVR